MASAGQLYTLVGFSPQVDWRPLTFVEPISANRVCSACGLVRQRTALLPCMHVLCGFCYKQNTQDAPLSCPLDGKGYEVEDVVLKDFPAEDLLRREVKCWNEASGCQRVTAVSGIAQHFLRQCEHHTVCCPKCSSAVPFTDVCAHLRSDVCRLSPTLASASDVPAGPLHETTLATPLDAAFERQTTEISYYLRPIAVGISAHEDRLNEISRGIHTLKEDLRQALATSTQQICDSLAKTLSEMAASNEELRRNFFTSTDSATTFSTSIDNLEKTLTAEIKKDRVMLSDIVATTKQTKSEVRNKGEMTLAIVRKVLRLFELQRGHCVFLIKGVKILEDTAMEAGSADFIGRDVYLRGYFLSVGVSIIKQEEALTVHGSYILHNGEIDDVLEWPFKPRVTLTFVHPSGGEDRVLSCRTKFPHILKRPTGSSGIMWFEDSFVLFQELFNEYEKNLSFNVKWELSI